VIGGLEDWRIGGLEDWRIGGSEDRRIGGSEECLYIIVYRVDLNSILYLSYLHG